ncbi:HET-domain-containing protein [Glonium stellatum]|uniref:HET-domain-containing protein n=1 Tax=Glonium stellatum TaxID=574774 RepID=A0A8E2F4W0_9PEZI|nr:HET-domain-containing protein [Glonium stellatum]
MTLAKSWLEDCVERHSHCPPTLHLEDCPLPSRVLYVGSKSSNLRLYISDGAKGKYAALSYCWGPPPHPWKTTALSLKKRTERIRLEELPKTMQDAIAITRNLSLSYLWIDALCIIQDSNDWDSEADKMGEYYSNAIVTISADGSVDSRTGCFVQQDRRCSVTAPVTFQGKDAVVRVRTASAWPFDGSHPPWASQSGELNKLSTRGWTLQEQLLSPRILHCTARELVWECVSRSACECKLRAEKPFGMRLKNRLIIENYRPRLASVMNVSNDLLAADGLLLRWNQVVYDFTLRNLTYASDRLPALSGLAAVMQKRMPSNNYFAGLWEEDFHMWLCWHTRIHNQEVSALKTTSSFEALSSRHETYCAPTWSWASITGSISMPLFDRKLWADGEARDSPMDIKLKVISISCVPAGQNCFGNLSSGELRCTGKLAPVTLGKISAADRLYIISNHSTGEVTPTALFYRDTYDNNGELEIGRSYLLLIILSHRPPRNDIKYPSLMYGLLLLKIDFERYKRVGLVIGYPDDTIGRYFTEDWETVSTEEEIIII